MSSFLKNCWVFIYRFVYYIINNVIADSSQHFSYYCFSFSEFQSKTWIRTPARSPLPLPFNLSLEWLVRILVPRFPTPATRPNFKPRGLTPSQTDRRTTRWSSPDQVAAAAATSARSRTSSRRWRRRRNPLVVDRNSPKLRRTIPSKRRLLVLPDQAR